MWSNPQATADLVTFTEEVLNGKLHFLCSVKVIVMWTYLILVCTANTDGNAKTGDAKIKNLAWLNCNTP